MTDTSRIDRMEVIVDRHDELIGRCVQAMEQQIKVDERLANHLEENKRQWAILDDHTQRLVKMTQQVAEMLAFYKLVRKVGWGVLGVLSGGLLYLTRFWPNAMAHNETPRDNVLSLQRTLQAAGYDPGPIDGRYGPQTSAAHTRYLNELPPEPAPEPIAKPWWLSRTIVGVVGFVIVSAMGLHNVDASTITDWLMQAIELGFAALAIWGRIRADRPIAPVRLPGRAGDTGRLRDGAVDLPADRRNQVPNSADDAGRSGWGDR